MSSRLSATPAIVTGIFYLVGLLVSVPGFAEISVRGEPLTASEIQVMPPVCKLIVVDIPNAHLGAGSGPLAKYAPLFDEPRYQMAKNNIHFHHYCWALVSKQRYFRERDKNKRNHYLSAFMGDIDYVLRHTHKGWPYFDVMLVEQGQMQAIIGNYTAALSKANEALRHQPNSEIAYTLKTDAYKNLGNKSAAITTAKEGLEKNPDSSRLRKRLTNLGHPVPPLAARPQAESPKESAVSDTSTTSAPTTSTSPTTNAAPENNVSTGDSEPTTPTPETIGTKNNPYCRFCP